MDDPEISKSGRPIGIGPAALLRKLRGELELFSEHKPLLIYQMGKVGSTALEEALPGALHLHTLYDNYPSMLWARLRRPGLRGLALVRAKFAMRRAILSSRPQIDIVSLVRDPVSRNVSMYFQDLQFWLAKHVAEQELDMRSEMPSLLDEAYQRTFDHSYYDTWFDREIRRFTGIDVFQRPFDSVKGWEIYSRGRYRVLVLKAEHLNGLDSVVSEFVGRSVSLKTSNVGDSKWYGPLYKPFASRRAEIEQWECSRRIRAGRTAVHFGYGNKGEKQ